MLKKEKVARLECKGEFRLASLTDKRIIVKLLCSKTETELISKEFMLAFDGCNIFEKIHCMSFADMF